MSRKTTATTEAQAPLLTVRELAALDGCSEKTVRRAIAAGLLDAVRIGPCGRLVRVTRAAHDAYRSRLRK